MASTHSYDDTVVSFYNIDAHSQKATLSDIDTYDTLVNYLQRAIPAGRNVQLFLDRALIAWLGHAQTMDASGARNSSPMTLVERMKRGRITHAEVFKLLCGYANIDCVVIEGRSKAIKYKVGDDDSPNTQGHSWNAFSADGKWHLLHPQWCIHVVIGYVTGNEIVMERDGKAEATRLEHREGQSKFVFNHFWFCTHPDIFVTRCLPDEQKWQLVSNDKRIENVNKFLAIPDLRQGYYDMKLSLLNEKSCRLKSKNGKCTISFAAPKSMVLRLKFSYSLVIMDADENRINVADMSLLVLNSRNQDCFAFEIRFPVVGKYRFKLGVSNINDDNNLPCAEFLIKCKEVDKHLRKLPIHTGIAGWGYGPEAEDAGITKVSERNSKIVMKASNGGQQNSKKITLKLDDEMMDEMLYEVEMYSSNSVDSGQDTISLTGFTQTTIDRTACKIDVKAHVEKEGEYALVVKARSKKGSTTVAKPILNYLLTTYLDDEEKEDGNRMRKQMQTDRSEDKKEFKTKLKGKLEEEYKQLNKETAKLTKQLSDEVDGRRQTDSVDGEMQSQACYIA